MAAKVPITAFGGGVHHMRKVDSTSAIVGIQDILPCRAISRLSKLRAVPKSSSLASATELMPCSSGVDVCHSLVGHTVSDVSWAKAVAQLIGSNENEGAQRTPQKSKSLVLHEWPVAGVAADGTARQNCGEQGEQ